MAYRIAAFGEVLWDLLATGRFLGGAPFNFVYRVASIGDAGTMVSRLGDDDLGRRALAVIERLGMSTAAIQRDRDHPTGTASIALLPGGGMGIAITPDVAYDYIEPSVEARRAVASADLVCFGTLIQRRETSRRTLHLLLESFRGTLRLLDLNLRRDCWTPETVRSSIGRAEVLKLSDDEIGPVAELYGLGPSRIPAFVEGILRATSLTHVVVTMGAGGAIAGSRAGERVYEPAFEVEVVDTLGSGDAFTAGFAHGLLARWPLERSVRYGNAMGAIVAGQHGATEPLAAADVERVLRDGRGRPPDPRIAG